MSTGDWSAALAVRKHGLPHSTGVATVALNTDEDPEGLYHPSVAGKGVKRELLW